MSHKGIRTLIEKTVLKLQDDVQFTYGNDTDFNQSPKKANLLVHLDPLFATPQYVVNGTQNYMKAWSVALTFLMVGKSSSLTYFEILDVCDSHIDRFVNDLNFFSVKSDQFILRGFGQEPRIKVFADILTGFTLRFELFANDDFDYCPEC